MTAIVRIQTGTIFKRKKYMLKLIRKKR